MTETQQFSLPHGRPFTVRDLDNFPDDGNCYELIEGELLIASMPALPHQTAMLELAYLLDIAAPAGFEVAFAPFALQPNANTRVLPDVVVASTHDITAPLLVAEILSSGGAIKDFHLKKALYERLAVPHYWVIDPIDPTITVFELDEHGHYRQAAEVEGDAVFQTAKPFPVRVVPGELLAG